MRTKSLRKVLKKEFDNLSFGGYLRAARTGKDMNQKEMAEFLGISKSSLCDIEKGRQIVSIDLAASIARTSGLSEVMAVEFTIKDHLRRAKLKLDVHISKVS